MKTGTKTITKVIICIALAFLIPLSFFVFANSAGSVEKHAEEIRQIDGSISSVMVMTGTTNLVSIAVTAIPDDIATPVAEQLAQFTDYFMVTLCILLAEKYLLTVLGFIIFRFVIPIACIAGIIGIIGDCEKAKGLAMKIALVGLAMAFAIPAGLRVSKMITDTYEVSFNSTIELGESIGEESESLSGFNIITKAKQLLGKITDFIKGVIEGIAVMIVTACIIPVLVFILMIWIIKTILGPAVVVKPVIQKERKEKLPPPLE